MNNPPSPAAGSALRIDHRRVVLLLLVLSAAAIPSCGDPPPPNDPPVEPPPEPLESEEVGFGAVGRFHVGHDGSANYVIPLRVPDGRRGVQPSISLGYNSNRSDAGLGVGWAVSGASAITRCRRIAALDGRAGRVEFDDSDALCLDGRRLVHVGGAPHAQEGAHYRPQRDGHELVILRKPLSDAESWFEVRLPNGDLREYGFQAAGNVPLVRGLRFNSDVDGRPEPIEEATRAWLINRHRDLAGNYMTYRYDHGTVWTESERAGYETHLVEIQYTGHDSIGPGQRFVRFEYATLPDGARQDRFENGLWEYSSKRLERVSMLAPTPTPLVRQYNLGYEESGHTGRSLLNRVEECDGNGRCLPATELEYTRNEHPSVSYESADMGPTPRGWYSDLAAGEQADQCARNFAQTYVLTDLDGSGEDDLLYFEQIAPCSGGNPLYFTRYAYYTRRNDGSGALGPARPAGIPDEVGSGDYPAALPPLIPFDIDDDGRTDIFDRRSYDGSGGVRIIRREWEPRIGRLGTLESDVFGCAAVPVGATSPDGRVNVLDAFLVGDIDGDGGPDLMAGCADTCAGSEAACGTGDECCAGLSCIDGVCASGDSCAPIGADCTDSLECCRDLHCYTPPGGSWFDPGYCTPLTSGVNWVVRAHDPSPDGSHDTLLPPVELFFGELASASSILLDHAGLGRLQMLVAAAPAVEATYLSAGTYEPAAPPGMTFPLAETNIPISPAWAGRTGSHHTPGRTGVSSMSALAIHGDRWRGVLNDEWHIDKPTWDEVSRAIQRLDAKTFTMMTIQGPDGQHLAVGGGAGQYVVYATFDNCEFWNLLAEKVHEGMVVLNAGGQEGEYPACQIVDLDQAQAAAQAFLGELQLAPTLRWEKQ